MGRETRYLGCLLLLIISIGTTIGEDLEICTKGLQSLYDETPDFGLLKDSDMNLDAYREIMEPLTQMKAHAVREVKNVMVKTRSDPGKGPPIEMREYVQSLISGLRNKIDSIADKLYNELTLTNKRVHTMATDLNRLNNLIFKVESAEMTLQWNFSSSTQFFVSTYYKQSKIYLFSKEHTKFVMGDAQKKCKSFGGYLLQLDSKEEFNFTSDYVDRFGKRNDVGFYTGYYSKGTDGGQPYDHKFSRARLGTNVASWGDVTSKGKCVKIQNGKLNADDCDKVLPYICEVPFRLMIDMLA